MQRRETNHAKNRLYHATIEHGSSMVASAGETERDLAATQFTTKTVLHTILQSIKHYKFKIYIALLKIKNYSKVLIFIVLN
jgi:hypothetical protein